MTMRRARARTVLASLAAECIGAAGGSARVATCRVSRYAEDVYTVRALARVMLEQLRGTHAELYRVSEPPARDEIKGRVVLVLDDASVSGGTLVTAHDVCVAAGAKRVHCVALKVVAGYPMVGATGLAGRGGSSGRRPPALPLQLPSFTPWGTF